MKVVLVRLSGNETIAVSALKARYPAADVVPTSRSMIETGSVRERIASVRRLAPDVFAVMTESLDWQYGQTALMLFGALCGARESAVFDTRGNWRVERRSTLISTGPFRLAKFFLEGKRGVARAKAKLSELERATDRLTPEPRPNGPATVAYLRTTPSAGTQPGGATSHINGVVKGLVGLGGKVRFIANDEIAGMDSWTVAFQKFAPQHEVMPRAAFDITNGLAFAAAAAETIAADPPSFIYERYSRFSFAGVEAARRARVPLFLEYNGSEVWVGRHWDSTARLDLLERYERLNLNAAARVFVISEVERRNLIDAGVADEKIVVNPNGVDADVFKPNIGGREERKLLDIADRLVVVGFVGTFGPWHGVLELAEAIALIPKDANVHFLLIGDGSLRGEVEERLQRSGDRERVTLTGVVQHDRVPALLDACDILISPHVPLAAGAEFFGSPTKLFEYMAMGKAIVASRLGQIGDVLHEDETGLLVEPGNAAALARAVQSLADDRASRTRIGIAARQAAIANHSWKQNAERILTTFDSMARQHE